MIKSNVADPHSGSSTVYSVALIAVHTMLFLSVWWNTWQASVAVLRNDNTQVTKNVDTTANKCVCSALPAQRTSRRKEITSVLT